MALVFARNVSSRRARPTGCFAGPRQRGHRPRQFSISATWTKIQVLRAGGWSHRDRRRDVWALACAARLRRLAGHPEPWRRGDRGRRRPGRAGRPAARGATWSRARRTSTHRCCWGTCAPHRQALPDDRPLPDMESAIVQLPLRVAESNRGVAGSPAMPASTTRLISPRRSAGITEASSRGATCLDFARLAHRQRHRRPVAAGSWKNLTKSFGGIHAVRGLSFDVRAGETLGLIGPNGAGKTTTFELVAGFVRAGNALGTVRYRGEDITRRTARGVRADGSLDSLLPGRRAVPDALGRGVCGGRARTDLADLGRARRARHRARRAAQA